MNRFQQAVMTQSEIADTLQELQRPYRLILDSMGLYSLYVEIPIGSSAKEWVERFWQTHTRLRATKEWSGVARPFEPENVRFLTPEEIAADLYLEGLFGADQPIVERLPVPHLPHWLGDDVKARKVAGPSRVVFYSYKGGVGRTTALVLVAVLLARAGKKVAIVDFDLEAPGVASFLLSRRPPKGVVDYLVERPALERMSPAQRIARLNDEYLGEVEIDFGGKGSISVLTAGRIDIYYPEKLAYTAIEDIERTRQNPLDRLFTHLNETLPDLDFILVDSRTGIADMGGSLLFKYANAICAFFYSNRQNREGMALLAEYLRRQGAKAPATFWIDSMSSGKAEPPHVQMQDFLKGTTAGSRGRNSPQLLSLPFLDQLRRLDWETLDRERPFEDPRLVADYRELTEAILGWYEKRRGARK